jgi:hypothetical protein
MSNLRDILDTESGHELKELLLAEYLRLCDINNVKDCKIAEAQALEFKAQKKAAEAVLKMLNKIMSVPEDISIDKTLDQYNV